MAETEESEMEDENNMTNNVTSDADTEAEPQEAKGEPSQTPTRQCESAKHAANKLLHLISSPFYTVSQHYLRSSGSQILR